jgi:hypothetical protein
MELSGEREVVEKQGRGLLSTRDLPRHAFGASQEGRGDWRA